MAKSWGDSVSILNKWGTLVNNELMSDVKFKFKDGSIIHAHRVVLGVQSDVFSAMLFGSMMEATSKEIYLTDEKISSQAFVVFLTYLYTGSAEKISSENILEVLYLAGQYQLPNLLKYCTEIVSSLISAENALLLWDSALALQNHEIALQCQKLAEIETQKCLNSVKHKDLSHHVILELVKLNTLAVPELELFNFVHKWISTQPTQNSDIFNKVMVHIRFPIISAKDLVTVVQPTGLISPEMYLLSLEFQACPTLEKFGKKDSTFNKRREPSSKEFTFSSDFDTNGILYFLGTNERTEEYTNPISRGAVELKTCQWHQNDTEKTKIIDWNLISGVQCYSHINVSNPWIEITFLNHTVFPHYYSLRGDNNTLSGYTLRNWVLEASNDLNQWTELRNHVNDTSLSRTASAKASWKITAGNSWPEKGFQTFRLRKTGPNGRPEMGGADHQYLMIQGVEIYGLLFPKINLR